MPNQAKLKIGAFLLDPSRNVLIGAEGECALEPKVVDVLVSLAAQPGAVLSRDELIDAVWKAEFGADERLTRAISMLRKAFHDERGAARYIETVSKRGYRLVATVEAVTDAGCVSAGPIAGSPPLQIPAREAAPPYSRASPGWQGYAVAGFFSVLAAVGVAATVWREPSTGANTQDLVELRSFVVIDGKPGMEAFTRQTGASLKRILASNQVNVVDGRIEQPAELAAREASEFILSGVVEQSDDQYAVTLYLDNRADSQTLWSRRFSRAVADGEGLREEIGANMAFVIACALRQRAVARIKPTTAVFKVYLESCEPSRYDSDGATHAMAERLIAAAPRDAFGHGMAALANAESSGRPGISESEAESYRVEAREAAARALELDPQSPYARVARAMIASPVQRWRELDAYADDGRIFHPCVLGHHRAALRTTGRLKEWRLKLEQAVAATPLSEGSRTYQAVMRMQAGNYEAAERLFAETLRLWPQNRSAHWYRFVNAAFYGEAEAALNLLGPTAKVLENDSDWVRCWQAFIQARARRGAGHNDARAACEGYVKGDDTGAQYVARMRAALGDVEGAYELMQGRSLDWFGATTFLFYPEMAAVRHDARFIPLIAESGLLEYWNESGHWPDFCSDEALPYDCKAAAARTLQEKVASGGDAVAPPP